MLLTIPQEAESHGFAIDGLGTHSSRTIMLKELQMLLAACPPTTGLEGLRAAIVEDNVLLKRTGATRQKSFRHLRELYGLDPGLVLFRALRQVWDEDTETQPVLALLCAVARDPSLRATAGAILGAEAGVPVTSHMIAKAFNDQYPGRLSGTTLAKVGRNAASSWTQSGHLQRRTAKLRSRAKSHPTSVAYALLLGYLCGARGDGLFDTLWARLLDTPLAILHQKAFAAAQRGWLEYRHAGDITDVSFRHLLGDEGQGGRQ